MKEIPVTKNDYDKSVILTSFLSEFKSMTADSRNIEDIVFIPKTDGYDITFIYNNVPSSISLTFNKSRFTAKMKVKYTVGAEKPKVFISENADKNREILHQVFNDN